MAEVFTVLDALVACRVDNVALFMDQTQVERIAKDIFYDLFTSCLDITFKELDDHFKTAYAELSAAQGQVRVRPGTLTSFVVTKHMRSFMQTQRLLLQLPSQTSLKRALNGKMGSLYS